MISLTPLNPPCQLTGFRLFKTLLLEFIGVEHHTRKHDQYKNIQNFALSEDGKFVKGHCHCLQLFQNEDTLLCPPYYLK